MKCEEKRSYITEREAILSMLMVKKIHGKRQRIYKCGTCIGWHLTSHLLCYQTQNDFGSSRIIKQTWLD
jgi:hypothetical protein